MRNVSMLLLASIIAGSWSITTASAQSFTDTDLAQSASVVEKTTNSAARAEANFWLDESRAAIKDGKQILARIYAERAEKIAGGGSARPIR